MSNSNSVYIGNQTAFSATNLMEPFEYAVANRFDAFEWFPDKRLWGAGWDETDLSPDMRTTIQETARTNALRLSVHGHWTINPMEETADLLRREIEMAEQLGASVFVLHLYTELGIAAYAKSLLASLQWAAAAGLKIAVENTVKTAPSDFNELFATLRRLGPPELQNVGMCFDMGHANLCAATRNNYLGFIDQLEAEVPIIHLHAHENWGDADTHLTLFTGPSAHNDAGVRGLIKRMRQRGYSGSIILEQWPQPPALLNQARSQLLRMWEEAS